MTVVSAARPRGGFIVDRRTERRVDRRIDGGSSGGNRRPRERRQRRLNRWSDAAGPRRITVERAAGPAGHASGGAAGRAVERRARERRTRIDGGAAGHASGGRRPAELRATRAAAAAGHAAAATGPAARPAPAHDQHRARRRGDRFRPAIPTARAAAGVPSSGQPAGVSNPTAVVERGPRPAARSARSTPPSARRESSPSTAAAARSPSRSPRR